MNFYLENFRLLGINCKEYSHLRYGDFFFAFYSQSSLLEKMILYVFFFFFCLIQALLFYRLKRTVFLSAGISVHAIVFGSYHDFTDFKESIVIGHFTGISNSIPFKTPSGTDQ